MFKIIINLILIYIIVYLIYKIYIKYSLKEGFDGSEPNPKDWLQQLFDDRQIITIPERYEHVLSFCNSFDIKPTIFNAILKKDLSYNNVYNLKIGEIACALSQEAVLKQFVNSNSNSLLMLEDDNMQLTHSFYTDIGLSLINVQDFIKNAVFNLPSDWDVLYFGRCWDDCNKHIIINDYIVKTKRTLCHHAIAFSKKGANTILSSIEHPLSVPIDHIVANLSLLGKINCYATAIPVFYQNRAELNSTIGNYDNLPICL